MRKKRDPQVFIDAVLRRGSRADSHYPESRVITPADVAQIFEAWQKGHLTLHGEGVRIATPGTGIAGIIWP